jgi:hypothetical protein
LLRYLDEIRATNKAYRDVLPERAQELDHLWRCRLSEYFDIKCGSPREGGLPVGRVSTSHRHQTTQAF